MWLLLSIGIRIYIVTQRINEAVLIHGGLNSLTCPIALNDCFVIYPFRNPSYLFNVDILSVVSHINEISENQLINTTARFGHTLVSIGNKSLLMSGGSSFQDETCSFVLDLMVNETNSLIIADIHPTLYHVNSYPSTSSSSDQHTFVSEKDVLPCGACRIHHTALVHNVDVNDSIYQPVLPTTSVHLLGGGSQCLAFGTHYCQSVCLDIICGTNNKTQSANHSDTKTLLSSSSGSILTTNNSICDDKDTLLERVIFVQTKFAKSIKTLLEDHHMIDKNRRIASAQNDPFIQSQIIHRFHSDTIETSCSNNEKIKLNNIILKEDSTQEEEDAYKAYASVPVIESFFDRLQKWNLSRHDDVQVLAIFNICDEIRIGYQNAKQNKLIEVSSHKKVKKFLDAFLTNHHMPSTSRSSYPSRYEIIGDVLMIPEAAFMGPEWQSIFTNNNENTKIELFHGIAQCFESVSRITRKARIKSNGKRESQVEILWSSIQITSDTPVTGVGSIGWVTVLENGISFSFDITRLDTTIFNLYRYTYFIY